MSFLHLTEPLLCLFVEPDLRYTLDHPVEVLIGVRAAGSDDLVSAAFASGWGQGFGTINRTNLRPHVDPFLLSFRIHPPPYDPPLATLFDMTRLTGSAGHAFASPLYRCRCFQGRRFASLPQGRNLNHPRELLRKRLPGEDLAGRLFDCRGAGYVLRHHVLVA
jgi:hypothetical protein